VSKTIALQVVLLSTDVAGQRTTLDSSAILADVSLVVGGEIAGPESFQTLHRYG